MPFVEIPSRQSSREHVDDVLLKVSHIRDNKTGRVTVLGNLTIGSNIARKTGMTHAEFVRMEKGTGPDNGRVQIVPATLGRKLRRTNQSGWASCTTTIPLNALGKGALQPKTYKLTFGAMPDGALVIDLP